MKRNLVLCAALGFALPSLADTYDFEVGARIASSDGGAVTSASNFFPATIGSSDTDEIGVFGTWFYEGLSDDQGPRSRAAFLSRASGVTFSYASSDSESEDFVPGIGGPIRVSSETDTDTFSLDVRHFFGDDGWFVDGGFARTDIDVTFDGPILGFADSISADALTLGAGKFIADRTSVEIGIAYLDAEGQSDTAFAASISHIGDFSNGWMWGGDAGVSFVDSDNRSYNGQFSLYPNQDLAFGLDLSIADGAFSTDTTTFTGFVDWFFLPNVSVRGEVFSADIDAGDFDADSDGFGLEILGRF